MFEELRKFKEREGHCNVPYRFSDNPKLGRWVTKQREMRLKISKRRASKLDSIGFTWVVDIELLWETMFEELRKFKEREGHCNVPSSYSDNPELGRWVSSQRVQRLIMSRERASKLDSIGFTWEAEPDVGWEIMFDDLRKFKEREGHCNVPYSYSENLELYRWVSYHRAKRLKISKERASKLDSIGFTWERNQDVRWEIMFEELRKYKDREGPCNVPYNYSNNPELDRWVRNQRGKRLKISNERVSKLDSIGFIWNRNSDAKWEIMFEELRKFKEREGHCNVSTRYSENPELGNWVRNQRSNRLKVSKERVSKLDSIGFTWVVGIK